MKLTTCVLGCLTGVAAAVAEEPKLFAITMSSSSENHARDYSVTFREINRTAATSLIEMVYSPPRLSPDLGELTTGMCLLLKSRRAPMIKYAVVSTEPLRFEVSFPTPDPNIPLDSMVRGEFSSPTCERWLSRFKTGSR
jgi:hypothetical protein